MPLSRRQARRQALVLLYQWDLSGQEIGSQYAGEIDPWARGVAEDVAARAPELDARITAAAEGSTAARSRRRWRSTRPWRSPSAMRPRTLRSSSTGSWDGYNGRLHDECRGI